jgi:hypothetical protein
MDLEKLSKASQAALMARIRLSVDDGTFLKGNDIPDGVWGCAMGSPHSDEVLYVSLAAPSICKCSPITQFTITIKETPGWEKQRREIETALSGLRMEGEWTQAPNM